MEIISGKIDSAQKVCIYGPEGIGKSSFAARFPNPLFIDTEGSTNNMDVRRLPRPTSWEMLLEEVGYVKCNPSVCQTLVIDTADWAEQLCISHVCAKAKKSGIEDFGYGKGYTYVMEEFGKLINLLTEVLEKNIHVVVTAHAKMRKFEQPDEIGSYDRWEMKLTKLVAPVLKEWADMLLFANYKTTVVATDDKGTKHKAQGGKRVMYTSHHPCWDGKNRHNLAPELPFGFEEVAHCIKDFSENQAASSEVSSAAPLQKTPPEPDFIDLDEFVAEPGQTAPSNIPKALADLMKANGVTEKDIQWAVSDKGYYPLETPIENYDPGFVEGVLIGAWAQVFAMIQEHNKLPF